jgi:hypothetical protein
MEESPREGKRKEGATASRPSRSASGSRPGPPRRGGEHPGPGRVIGVGGERDRAMARGLGPVPVGSEEGTDG